MGFRIKILCSLNTYLQKYPRREGTIDWNIHLYPKFYNHVFLCVISKTFGIFYQIMNDWLDTSSAKLLKQ